MQLKITVPQLFRGRERQGARGGKKTNKEMFSALSLGQGAGRKTFPQIMGSLDSLKVLAASPHRGFPKI